MKWLQFKRIKPGESLTMYCPIESTFFSDIRVREVNSMCLLGYWKELAHGMKLFAHCIPHQLTKETNMHFLLRNDQNSYKRNQSDSSTDQMKMLLCTNGPIYTEHVHAPHL